MVNWQGRCDGVAWIYGRLTPASNRGALNTNIPNVADLLTAIHNTMHIYLWQIDATTSPPINHRCLENHYTKQVHI